MSSSILETVVTEQALPIVEVLPKLCAVLRVHDMVVLEAPPGAGKTTLVPLALLAQSWCRGKKIIVLEPRRLAARNAANRMAALLGETCGKTVGYRVRLDTKVSALTRIEVVTEGIFTRMLQADPTLDDVAVVVFDEFHERSLDADLGLALLRQSALLYGDMRDKPVKTVVMSATLNGAEVSEYLDGAPVVTSSGRMFPVSIEYSAPYAPEQNTSSRAAATIKSACMTHRGSVLVFLPGRREIENTATRLKDFISAGELPDTIRICPLFGELSLAEQQRAIAAPKTREKKVVLATNIAESSLTIDGVRIVIDSGLQREARYDPSTGMTRLHLCRISKASAEQRAGRAGRLSEGVCIRLWSKSQQDELAQFTSPEITNADMVPLALQLLKWGEADVEAISWLSTPSEARFSQAMDLLRSMGATIGKGRRVTLTQMGEQMAELPTHPRLAHMLVKAKWLGVEVLASQLAAVLDERDIGSRAMGVDLSARLECLSNPSMVTKHLQPSVRRIKQVAAQLFRTLDSVFLTNQSNEFTERDRALLDESESIGLLVALAFPDRVAKKKESSQTDYLLVNGRQGRLFNDDRLVGNEWLAIAEVSAQQGRSDDVIRLAAPVSLPALERVFEDRIKSHSVCYWDEKAGRVVSEFRRELGAIILSRSVNKDASDEEKRAAILAFVQKKGLSVLNWSEEALALKARVSLAASLTQEPWPDWSDENLLATIEEWLLPFIGSVTTLTALQQVDVEECLKAFLTWNFLPKLDMLVPRFYTAPSGRRVLIDYTSKPPVIAIKLQEMFGAAVTPSVANGRVPLLIHLLSPAGRPLQVTQDLVAFWNGAYSEVKKEMKGRYPKHPWPDDPTNAEPTRKTKSQLSRSKL